MLVSLFTDASLGTDGAAGWGFWAKANGRGPAHGGGPLRDTYRASSEAEFAAIANGLQAAINRSVIQPGDTVLIQTDAMVCVHILDGTRRKRLYPLLRRIKAAIDAAVAENGLTVKVRHVKAHLKRDQREPRHHINEVCDRHAKAGQRKARQQRSVNEAAS